MCEDYAKSIANDVEKRINEIEAKFSSEFQIQLARSRERLEKIIRRGMLATTGLLFTILAATLIVGYTQAQNQVQDRVYALNQELISLQKDLIATHKELQTAQEIVAEADRRYQEAQHRLKGAEELLTEATIKANDASEELSSSVRTIESSRNRLDGLEREANSILSRLRKSESSASRN